MIVAARWIDPPTTAVHVERRLQAWSHGAAYHERYEFVPLDRISLDLQHAVIAAEDANFYHHHGFDWHEIEIAAEDDLEGERTRGASTITQQLVKNLFFGTGRSFLRKGAEASLVPVAELVLGKRRILEIYHEMRWSGGRGCMGRKKLAGITTRFRRRASAGSSPRDWRRFLAAPLKRRPERMNRYSAIILGSDGGDGVVSSSRRSAP